MDWQNVTAGHDIDTEWGTSGDYFVRNGWTWIGASVQRVGVNGATAGATANLGLKQWNPTRYASLRPTNGGTVLDDTQSFDVYTQIGQLAKGTSRDNPLADLRLNKVYAAGASQSARFLGIYYNTVQPIAPVFDGFLFAIGGSSLPPRAAVGTKAMRVFTENDVLRGALVPSQQMPDSDVLRTWAIAGASHVPGYATNPDPENFRSTLGGIQAREYGPGSPRECTEPRPEPGGVVGRVPRRVRGAGRLGPQGRRAAAGAAAGDRQRRPAHDGRAGRERHRAGRHPPARRRGAVRAQ